MAAECREQLFVLVIQMYWIDHSIAIVGDGIISSEHVPSGLVFEADFGKAPSGYTTLNLRQDLNAGDGANIIQCCVQNREGGYLVTNM